MSADEQVQEAISILEQIIDDQSVPRNIRRAAQKSIDTLNDQAMELPVRAINAIETLEETTGDPNCPFHCRTMLFMAITRLELPDDDDDEWEYEDDDDWDDDDWEYEDDDDYEDDD